MRSGRNDLGGEQTWRPEHQGISASSKHGPARSRNSWDKTREADPFFAWGRPMTSWKKQVRAHGVPPGYGIQHPRKDSQRYVGKLPGAAGTAYNLPGLFER